MFPSLPKATDRLFPERCVLLSARQPQTRTDVHSDRPARDQCSPGIRTGGNLPRITKLDCPIAVRVEQPCRRLHFLHATDQPEADATPVAAYVIHYADGQQLEVPLLYGREIQAWIREEDPPAQREPLIAWSTNAGGGITLQLCHFTWDNPRPSVTVESLDFVSEMTRAAPFILAITAEP